MNDADVAWITGATGVAGSLLGAIVGSFATYRVNLKMREHQAEHRAAVRAKAKIYIPVRADLISLIESVGDAHRFKGHIQLSDRQGRGYATSYFTVWPTMLDDGRALSAARNVRHSLDQAMTKIAEYNAATDEAQSLCNEAYIDACRQLFNHEASTKRQSLGEYRDVVLESEDDWAFRVWGVSADAMGGDEKAASARMRAAMLADDRCVRARELMLEAERSLLVYLDASRRVLDVAIEEIGEKYEKALRRHG